MKNCPQSRGQSTLDHGFSVKNHLFDLLDHLRFDKPLKYEWKIPNWTFDSKELILSSLPTDDILKRYTILHDCGKWKCLKVVDGKNHFPNHSQVSFEIYKDLFGYDVCADLIKHDMDIHTLKSSNLADFCNNENSLTLLLVGLCEINSNAKMFGGFESDSFKIKYKSILKMGKKIIDHHEKVRN